MSKRIFLTLITLITILALSGCHDKKREILRVGTNSWPGYEPLYLAASRGDLSGHVEIERFGSTSEVLNAFRKGEIQVAALTMDEAILLKDQGYTPKVIAVMDISDGADVVLAKPEITSIEQLKGKTIGLENSALGSYMLARLLQHAGFGQNLINVFPLSVDHHAEAFKEGVVDAVITFEPVRSELLKEDAREIFTSKAIPNEIVDVLVVSETYAGSKAISTLIKGWDHAAGQMKAHDEQAVRIIAGNLNQTPEEFIGSLEGLKIPSAAESEKMLTDGTMLNTIEKIKKVMLDRELITHNFDAGTLLLR